MSSFFKFSFRLICFLEKIGEKDREDIVQKYPTWAKTKNSTVLIFL
jgi:hypothetical protein